jgi:hypothetical protein
MATPTERSTMRSTFSPSLFPLTPMIAYLRCSLTGPANVAFDLQMSTRLLHLKPSARVSVPAYRQIRLDQSDERTQRDQLFIRAMIRKNSTRHIGQVLDSPIQRIRHSRPNTCPHFLITTAGSGIGFVVEIELCKIDEDGAASMIMGSWQMGQVDGTSSSAVAGRTAVSRV